jgi:DNA polymerase-3 subunit gamma/tau
MAHQSLYRTYRPATFGEVRGQEQVTKALSEQIAAKKVAHAYLFSGSRGLGKTSIARIFAHELGATNKDLYEIDAASNNSVDDIRQLTENVYTLPFESPYKVYILDEAHMLSKGAWNAFLKTLEEPPAHVVFILATTELSKVPETVLSRCQVYEFKKPSRAGLATMITEVAKNEGYTIDPSAADLVALLGDGSYRDSLSILEKVLSSVVGKKISREDAEIATGAPRSELVHSLITAIHEGSADAALSTVRKVSEQSIDMSLYLSLVLEEARVVLLIRTAPELRAELKAELGVDSYGEIEKIALSQNSKLTHRLLLALLNATERQRFSPIPSLPLELALFEVLT